MENPYVLTVNKSLSNVPEVACSELYILVNKEDVKKGRGLSYLGDLLVSLLANQPCLLVVVLRVVIFFITQRPEYSLWM